MDSRNDQYPNQILRRLPARDKRVNSPTRIIGAILVCAIGVLQCGCASAEEKLRSACGNANRIVVSVNAPPTDVKPADLPRCEIIGADHVAGFFSVIEVAEMRSWCKCLGDMIIEFYDGEELLAKMSIHHGRLLRWRDGNWSGQALLTDRSIKSLESGLQENECPTIKKAIEACRPG